ncbi:protein brambleberry [Microcaecilia unicolor]|uniref:Protein brambleberry-like n=1 Tax=Microcaecilia unicolor TaxID=1415580 RepID=A0A6P7XCG7_9AMPH|nr:protein brambleberry-like [Microcaecilia unicolor]
MRQLLLMLLYLSFASTHPETILLHQGQAQLQRVEGYASHPRYGACWTRALKRVNMGCRRLSEEEQGKIALSFTHCHLQRSGRSFPECGDGSSVRDCTQDMDPVAFGTYTEFFTHTHSICYFLQNEIWQQEAEDTMSRLTANSDNAARQLETASQMAEETMKAQNAVLMSQEEILQNGEFLKKSLQDSTNGVKQAFQDMQQATTEQRLLFAEIFNQLTYLQQFVVGESSMMYSILYSLLASVAAFLLTTTKRTAGARLILFGLVAVNVYVERSITTFVLGNSESSYEAAERVSFWVSLVRRVSALLGIAILLGFIMCHRDVSKESLKILQSLQTRQNELQHILRETEKMLSEAYVIPRSAAFSSSVHAMVLNSRVLEPLVSQDFTTKPQDSNPIAKSSITPKKRSNSPSHWRSSHSTEPAVCSIPESPSSYRAESAVYRAQESPSRRKGRHKAELAVYSVPVSLESQSRYSLRNRTSVAGSVRVK